MRLVLLASAILLTACGGQLPSQSSITTAERGYENYPDRPDVRLTPGSVCQKPDELRYPERIKYCRRHVATRLKYEIIDQYDERLGFRIGQMKRQDFKIDHYIALCMGGSNNHDNLWPQHKSIYKLTDPIEEMLCRLMAQGDMTQTKAIATLKHVKNNLDEARDLQDELRALLGR